MANPTLQGDIETIVLTLTATTKKAAGYCPLNGEHTGNPCPCGYPSAMQKNDLLALEAALRLQHNLNRIVERRTNGR